MHDRQDLVSRLQDEIRTWDEELATANDGRYRTLAGQRRIAEGGADGRRSRMHLLFDQNILPLAQHR